MENDSFVTIANNSTIEFTEKKSIFIASAYLVKKESDVNEIIEKTKKQYIDATHNCYAYMLKSTQRFNDDGEPSGTAGMPILNVITKMGLSNTLVIVTRYFGGIKLGAGGLVRTYSAAAAEVLLKAGKSIYVKGSRGTVEIDYNDFNTVERLLLRLDCEIENKTFDRGVEITFTTKDDWNSIAEAVNDACNGGALSEFVENIYIKQKEI